MEKENKDSSIDAKINSNSSPLVLEETLANLKIADQAEVEEKSIKNNSTNITNSISSNSHSNNQDDEEGVLEDKDIEPANLWGDDDSDQAGDPFTEEELINVLRSFDEEDTDEDNNNNNSDDNNSDDNIDFPTGEALPDLEVEADDSMLLLDPAEFTASIFDPPNNKNYDDKDNFRDFGEDNSDDNSAAALEPNTDIESEENTEQIDPFSARSTEEEEEKGNELIEEIDALGLLEGLKNLNLDWKQDDDYNIDYKNDSDFDIPPYLYCQPCTPEKDAAANNLSLASISEDQVLSLDPRAYSVAFRQLLEKETRKLPEREFDTLLQLSLMGLEGETHANHAYPNDYLSEAEMDSLFTAQGPDTAVDSEQSPPTTEEQIVVEQMEQQLIQQQQQQEQQPTPFHVSHRSEALSAASEIVSSFVVANASSGLLKNERSCLGHKETTYGANFSECGKYLATASQDSTVRIWDVARNAPLTTLTEHSTEYECLRVAWYDTF